jgi:outer membrane protein assembly factor BamA
MTKFVSGFVLFGLVCGHLSTPLHAQNINKEQEEVRDMIHPDLVKQKMEKEKNRARITPFIAPGYSPELQYSLSGGALASFSTNRKDTTLLRSSVPLTFTVSSTGSWLFTTNWTTYFHENKLRINATLQYRNMADHYFGVGYDNGKNTSFPDSTRYNRVYFQVLIKPVWKVSRTMYLGFIYDHNSTTALDVNEHMKKDPYYIQYGSANENNGLGLVVSYDTRDFPQNAYRGAYASFSYTNYSVIRGQNQYSALELDYRKFIPVGKKIGRTLAINVHSRHAFNGVPYGELSFVGSPFDVRGYRLGRFRDRIINYFIAEYRHKVYGNSFLAKRSGWVVWAGIGCLGSVSGESFFVNNLPNAGVGYRFEVQHRLNVRVDFGVGVKSNGLYFNFQEAY